MTVSSRARLSTAFVAETLPCRAVLREQDSMHMDADQSCAHFQGDGQCDEDTGICREGTDEPSARLSFGCTPFYL